jgi:hypothetical protein
VTWAGSSRGERPVAPEQMPERARAFQRLPDGGSKDGRIKRKIQVKSRPPRHRRDPAGSVPSCASCPPRSLRVQGSSTSFDRCPPEPRVVATLVRPPGVPAVGWSWCGQVRSAVSGVASAARLTGHPRRTRASRDRDAAMGAGGSRQALDSRATSSMLHGCMASRLAHEQAPACSQPSVHPYPSRHRALRARGERGRRT